MLEGKGPLQGLSNHAKQVGVGLVGPSLQAPCVQEADQQEVPQSPGKAKGGVQED